MLALAEQKHHVPGRLRLSVPSAKRDGGLLERLREQLVRLPGVRSIEVNPTTTGVIVHYDPALYVNFPSTLAKFAAENNILTLCSADALRRGTNESSAKRTLEAVLGRANSAVQGGTRNAISLKEVLPFGIFAWSVIFVDPAMAAAQWLSWMAFAWSAYFDLHQDEPVQEVGQQVKALQSDIAAIRALLEQRAEPSNGNLAQHGSTEP